MVDSLAKCKLTKALVDPERELRMRIEYAAHWIRNHYRESSGGIPRGYISEQGGIPLTIVRANDNYSPRHNGIYRYRLPGVGLFQVYTRLAWTPPPNVGGRVDGEEYWDATHVTFDCCADVSTIIPFVDWAYNGPSIDVRRDYQTADKKTKVTLTFKGMDCTSHSVDLYWMDEKLATVNHNTPINTQWIRYTDAWGAFPSSKYTIRHGIQMAEKFWHSQGDEPKAAACRQTKTDHGYTCDIYDPMWGWKDTNGYDDDFMFCRTPFRDSEVGFDYEQNAHSHGLNPYRYGYESKVNFMNIDIPIDLAWVHEEWHVESVDIYIASLAVQSYGKALQAIHILNKYDDPDKEYDDVCMNRSVPDIWNRKKTTPRKVARYIEKHMMADNNIGVKSSDIRLPGPWDMHFSVPAFSKESWSASAYSTCAFHILESLLGYKYKDVTSKSYADILLENVLLHVQWGVHYPGATVDGWGENEGATYGGTRLNHHKMFRPNYTGSCMIVWCKGEEYPYSLTKGGGGIPYVEDVMLMDPFNMPPEDTGILPSNMEATMSYYQALRTYAFYKYGVGYPTTACIPGLGFFEPPS